MLSDHKAAIAPKVMKPKPRAIPLCFKTKGKVITPEPMAEEQRAKIEPRKEPLSIFLNVLWKRFFLLIAPGERGAFV